MSTAHEYLLNPLDTIPLPTAHEYLRVSADRSGREKSQGEQHDENQEHRDDKRWITGRQYKDTGSASRYSKKARGDFDQLMKDLADPALFPKGDILQMWESSRGSRRSGQWASLLDLCVDRGVLIYVTTHGSLYDPKNPRHYRSLMEDAVDSEYESGKTSLRVLRDVRAAAKAGRPHGRPLYGYRRIYNDRPPFKIVGVEVDRDEAKPVITLIAEIARGTSLRAIRKILHDEYGLNWDVKRMRYMAMNFAYIGKRRHHDQIFDAIWPIITEGSGIDNDEFVATFYKAQRKLNDPKRVTVKPGGARHLVTMIARCACGGPITATNRRGVALQGWCHDKGHVYVDLAKLETYVETQVIDRLSDPARFEQLRTEPDADRQLLAMRADLAELQDRFSQTRRQVVMGKISADSFAEMEPEFLVEIKSREQAIAQHSTPPALRELFSDPESSVVDQWTNMSLAAKRDVIREVVQITVNRLDRRSRRNATIEDLVTLTWLM